MCILKSQDHGNPRSRIVFNGQEIEISTVQDDFCQILTPALVKEKWRKTGLMQGQDRASRSGVFHRSFCAIQYIQDTPCTVHNCGSDDSEFTTQYGPSQMSVWNGWLNKLCMSLFSGSVLRQWRRRWFVLTLNHGQFTMEYYIEDCNLTCGIKLKRSLLIDQHKAARREWTSSRSVHAYFSIPITGRKRRLVLASTNPGEADFLVSSINAIQLKFVQKPSIVFRKEINES